MPGLHLILFHSLLPNKEVLPNTCSVLILLVQTMLRISADMLIYVPIYRNWQVTYKIKPYRLCLSFGPIIGLQTIYRASTDKSAGPLKAEPSHWGHHFCYEIIFPHIVVRMLCLEFNTWSV
jgi:hypothetical protein